LNITEVRVKLMRNRSDRLRAFCSITIDDDFVVHDLRVIEGRKGFFVAMPSRKLTDNCPRCSGKNELRAKFCGECGNRLSDGRQKDARHEKVHVDVAHPINTICREMLQQEVLAAYREEAGKAGQQPAGEGAPEGEGAYDELAEEYDEEYDLPEGVEKAQTLESEEPILVDLEEEAEGLIEEVEPEEEPPAPPRIERFTAPESKELEAERPAEQPRTKRERRREDSGGFGQGII